MTFLFTLIGILAIGFLLWRTFGPQLTDHSDHVSTSRRGPVGPDDDPDFLMDLDRRTGGGNDSDDH